MSASLIAAVRERSALPEVTRVERRVERLGAEARQQGMVVGRPGQPEHRPEAARVVVAQERPVVEHEIDVVVRPARGRLAIDAQASRHAEMDQQRFLAQAKQ